VVSVVSVAKNCGAIETYNYDIFFVEAVRLTPIRCILIGPTIKQDMDLKEDE
jgi:hypothetical protein